MARADCEGIERMDGEGSWRGQMKRADGEGIERRDGEGSWRG